MKSSLDPTISPNPLSGMHWATLSVGPSVLEHRDSRETGLSSAHPKSQMHTGTD